jgi:Flp pilus assembly protein TadB
VHCKREREREKEIRREQKRTEENRREQKRTEEKRREKKRKEEKRKQRTEDNRPNYLSKVKVNGEDGMSTSLEKVVAIMVYPFVFATNVLFRHACNGT